MIEKERLKHWATELANEIQSHSHESNDVRDLAEYKALMDAIEEAKLLKIDSPRRLGNIALFEEYKNFQKFPELEEALSCFHVLLQGLWLP